MTTLDPSTWEALMDRLVVAAEQADFVPGDVSAPGAPPGSGSGTEGDDPLSVHYAELGPLAYVLNEAMDSAVTRGLDRDALLEEVGQEGGEGVEPDDVEKVLSGDDRDPDPDLLAAFATVFDLDLGIVLDAARRGGAKRVGPSTTPPGY